MKYTVSGNRGGTDEVENKALGFGSCWSEITEWNLSAHT